MIITRYQTGRLGKEVTNLLISGNRDRDLWVSGFLSDHPTAGRKRVEWEFGQIMFGEEDYVSEVTDVTPLYSVLY